MELDPQVSPEEIMSREVELGCESWTSFASGRSSTAVQRTLSLSVCLCLSVSVCLSLSVCLVTLCPSTVVETAIARCTSRWAMARGHALSPFLIGRMFLREPSWKYSAKLVGS